MPVKHSKTKVTSSQVASDSEYSEFLSGLKLIGLGLKSSAATLDRQKFWKLTQEQEKSRRRVSETYKVTGVGEKFFEAEVRYEVCLGEADAVGLRISCTFEVHMHARPPIDKAMVERFSNSDLRFILLPYARHFISDMTGEMQIPPVVLPLVAAARKTGV